MIRIENEFIQAEIAPIGAEIIVLKRRGAQNVLWKKEDSIWNRTSPNLFPIVGRLIDDSYTVKGQKFQMNQHGFARDCLFEVIKIATDEVRLLLRSSEQTRVKYPFEFEFIVTYRLMCNQIEVSFQTKNLNTHSMPYSVGGHPGFAIGGELSEYQLDFHESMILERSILDGPFYSGKLETMDINKELSLENELFENDALVFKSPPFSAVTLTHKSQGPMVTLSSNNWEAVGFWTKPFAPFFCIEPWWGWADHLNSSGDLEKKTGVHLLLPNQMESVSFTIELH
jgi:galactose mutarotase-like enzyme